MHVAVQEYGVANIDLINGLKDRGADVTQVPVYQWALPEDVEPLRSAVTALSRGEVDVTMFTTATQVVHLFQVVREMQLEETVRRGLAASVMASIGPTTSEELRREGLAPDLEPSHPKMGLLVKETAERSVDLLRRKR
jgi:uroporphyrinogen-III synthase